MSDTLDLQHLQRELTSDHDRRIARLESLVSDMAHSLAEYCEMQVRTDETIRLLTATLLVTQARQDQQERMR